MAFAQSIVSTAYPFLRVRVTMSGEPHEALALVDTGFEGAVVVPDALLDSEGTAPVARGHWQLADGSIIDAPLFLGMVEVVGFPSAPATITVLGEEYILGRGVIDRFRVTLDHGERIIVES